MESSVLNDLKRNIAVDIKPTMEQTFSKEKHAECVVLNVWY